MTDEFQQMIGCLATVYLTRRRAGGQALRPATLAATLQTLQAMFAA